MLVRKWMNTQVITVDQDLSMVEAMNLMKQHNVQMLPVLKKKKLVGIVTDRDIKRASASDATTLDVWELRELIANIKVKHIMSREPVTVPPDHTVEETADMLLKHKISGVPVVDRKGAIVGVVTQADLFKLLISLTGGVRRGIQFGCQVEDRSGSIKEVADILRRYGGRMVSILTSYEGVPDGCRRVFIRVFGVNRSRLDALKEELRQISTLLYIIDHLENRREIFADDI